MRHFNIAVIVGSNRRESINRQLANALRRLAPELRFIEAKIDDLPMYNQDIEKPVPDSVARFKRTIEEADGVLVVSPEHSRSVPAVLKNALDWGSRPWGRNSWSGKPALITGASPGGIGTAVGQQHLRFVLGVLGATVLGGEAYLTFKQGLIDEDGAITDETTRQFFKGHLDRFVLLVGQVSNTPVEAAAA